jgi:hypothetical protein
MPKKLTKYQRQYRKRKKEASKEVIRIIDEDGKTSLRVAKRSLCIRVSEEAFDALTVIANAYGKDKGEMISYMIGNSIQRWQTLPEPMRLHQCDGTYVQQRNAEPKKPRLNGTGAERQINVRISSTAWKKLDDFCVQEQRTRYSKKRVVEQLILDYARRASQDL